MSTLVRCVLLASLVACERAPIEVGERQVPPAAAQAAECTVDSDCGLMPSVMTCCGECDPVPPYDAVPRTAIDAVLIELDTRCPQKPVYCEPLECQSAPPGCEAYASCVGGQCVVIQSGACGALIASRR